MPYILELATLDLGDYSKADTIRGYTLFVVCHNSSIVVILLILFLSIFQSA